MITKELINIPQQQFVLEPCHIPESINIDYLKSNIQQYMTSRQDFYRDTKRSLFIEDEFSEWWLAKSSNGHSVGKGNEATDIITSQKEGIDAMCVIMNGYQSNEKSLVQNFNASGYDLDNLFKNNDEEIAVELFMNGLKTKLLSVISKYELTKLYILAYVSCQKEIHICCFHYCISQIDNIVSSGISKQGQSISVKNFINDKWGNVKLYKAKKRVEMRLKKACITENPFAVKIYELQE